MKAPNARARSLAVNPSPSFAAYWVKRRANSGDCTLTVLTDAAEVWLVLRSQSTGEASAPEAFASLEGQAEVMVADRYFERGEALCYLFTDFGEADRFAATTGWTAEEQAALPTLLPARQIPGVDQARALKANGVMMAFEQDGDEASMQDAINQLFTPDNLVPTFFTLKDTLVAAPGNPPKWIPPQ